MICRNCSGRYHGLKNCPNPPNLNIAMQSFMEFVMQQMTVFHSDQRFAFPAGTVAAPVSERAPVKAKKDKSIKKAKKTPQKRMKVEARDPEDEEDSSSEATEASSESEESESSDEPQPAPVSKQKRKRGSKAPTAASLAPPVFPFPLLGAPGAPYNSMMYPYGTPFSFPK